jgi:peroxiredoxin
MFRKLTVLAFLLAALCIAARADVAPGDKAPEFELFGVDYTYHSLERYAEAEAIVVVFTCNHCPVAQAYEDKLIAIAKAYQPRGVQFVAANPNPADMVAADGFPQMVERAEEKGFPFPYVYDETQKVARAYGATVTPHVFVVNAEGTIVYTGAVDNRHAEPDYLTDALEDVLAGREVAKPTSAQFGCSVKYRPEPDEEDKGA